MRLRIGMISLMAFAVVITALSAWGGVVGSRHDLSTRYDGGQVCIYCHTPHYANTDRDTPPLWNRTINKTLTFTPYTSATMDAVAGQPKPSSLACLGCHDGVNAYIAYNGNQVSTKHDLLTGPGGSIPDMVSAPNCERCHSNYYSDRPRVLVLGTNLSNDHPISIAYPTTDNGLVAPVNGAVPVSGASKGLPLFGTSKDYLECSTCHNVHEPGTSTKFLRVENTGSALCKTCHLK
jgi:predicted CXXCH cytochrome family protein